MRNSPLESAILQNDIPSLWQQFALPGLPGKSCRSPFREDRNPSFSIYDSGKRWKDHGTGESGGAVEFIAKAKGINESAACRWLIDRKRDTGNHIERQSSCKYKSTTKSQFGSVRLPPYIAGTDNWVEPLQQSRKLPNAIGIQVLLNRKILRFGGMYDGRDPTRVWLVVDSSYRNAQAK